MRSWIGEIGSVELRPPRRNVSRSLTNFQFKKISFETTV